MNVTGGDSDQFRDFLSSSGIHEWHWHGWYHRWWVVAVRWLIIGSHVLRLVLNGWVILLLLLLLRLWWHVIQRMVDVVGLGHHMTVIVVRLRYHALLVDSRLLLLWPDIYDNPCKL